MKTRTTGWTPVTASMDWVKGEGDQKRYIKKNRSRRSECERKTTGVESVSELELKWREQVEQGQVV